MKQVYVDANIFLNYWFDEYTQSAEAYYSQQFFRRTAQCEFFFVITNLTVEELAGRAKLSIDEVMKKWLSDLVNVGKMSIESISQKDVDSADVMVKRFRIPRKDAMHAAFCLNHKLPIITRDKHFRGINQLDVFVPEDL